MGGADSERKLIASNRKARFDYEILDSFEAGIALLGPEVKSLRAGKASIAEAYASHHREELFLREMHIPEYTHAGYAPHDPKRVRKLLLHRREINKLAEAVEQKGLTIVPLQVYFKKGRAKVELALVRGRKLHDKREKMKGEADRREARSAEGRRG